MKSAYEQVKDDQLQDMPLDLGYNKYSIKDARECLATQKELIGNLEGFLCCGSCQSTRDPTDCVGLFFNFFCLQWWMIIAFTIVVVIIFSVCLCWRKKWLCFKADFIAKDQNYPVGDHNREANNNPEFFRGFGPDNPAMKLVDRVVFKIRSSVMGSPNAQSEVPPKLSTPAPSQVRGAPLKRTSSFQSVRTTAQHQRQPSQSRRGSRDSGRSSRQTSPSAPVVRKTRVHYVPQKRSRDPSPSGVRF